MGGSLLAQTSAGTLAGLVRDSAGSAIPEAVVTVTNTQTNVSSRLVTDASGSYFVPGVVPGIYSVSCEHPGFKRVVIEPVTVSVNQTVRVNLDLPVGDVAESVTVQEYASLVQSDNATIGQVVTTRQLTELPLNGRDFRNLLSLNPGVTQPHDGIVTSASIRLNGFNDNFRLVSINGARPSSVSYLVDGVSMNEPLFQFPSQVPPIEAVDEFKLQNALYSAEFGMGVGQVSIAMKSGTNELHGSLWDFLR
ncbi:MAG TPA: carboxypeptidase regulatory-like domain-containing protein, partial [Bryobacteraceae bacterium]|nr:carboxypeptidase regulatory-like domain-containing protein [Bryobacteraceae bacterium]